MGLKETKEQRTMEDMLINEFIGKDLPKWDPKGPSGQELVYATLPFEDKSQAEIDAFKFFYDNHELKKQDNPRYKEIEFENYLKLSRPEELFKRSLMDVDVPTAPPALAWRNVFAENTGVMKYAAMQGLKRIMAQQSKDGKAELRQNT